MFAYCWMYHFRGSVVEGLQKLWFKGNMLEITIYGVVLFLLSSMYGGMRLGYLKNVEVIFSQVFATLMAYSRVWRTVRNGCPAVCPPYFHIYDGDADDGYYYLH